MCYHINRHAKIAWRNSNHFTFKLTHFLHRLSMSAASHLFPHIITILNSIISQVCELIINVCRDSAHILKVPVIENLHSPFEYFEMFSFAKQIRRCQTHVKHRKNHFRIPFSLIEFSTEKNEQPNIRTLTPKQGYFVALQI